MTSKIKQIILTFLVLLVVVFALLGVLYAFDVITVSELKDYASKVGIAVLVVMVASVAVSLLLSVNKKE
ncbi:MAG: hypothetical protein AAB869_00850 [Patescibacteria group bacterium]